MDRVTKDVYWETFQNLAVENAVKNANLVSLDQLANLTCQIFKNAKDRGWISSERDN